MYKRILCFISVGLAVTMLTACGKKGSVVSSNTASSAATIESAIAESTADSNALLAEEEVESREEEINALLNGEVIQEEDNENGVSSSSTDQSDLSAASSSTISDTSNYSGTNIVEQAHDIADSGKTWEDVLNESSVPISDDIKEYMADMDGNTALQVEYALAEINGAKNRRDDYDEYLYAYETLIRFGTESPYITSFNDKMSTLNGYAEAESALSGIIADGAYPTEEELSNMEQSLISLYDFLDENAEGIDVDTSNTVVTLKISLGLA